MRTQLVMPLSASSTATSTIPTWRSMAARVSGSATSVQTITSSRVRGKTEQSRW